MSKTVQHCSKHFASGAVARFLRSGRAEPVAESRRSAKGLDPPMQDPDPRAGSRQPRSPAQGPAPLHLNPAHGSSFSRPFLTAHRSGQVSWLGKFFTYRDMRRQPRTLPSARRLSPSDGPPPPALKCGVRLLRPMAAVPRAPGYARTLVAARREVRCLSHLEITAAYAGALRGMDRKRSRQVRQPVRGGHDRRADLRRVL